MSRIVEISIRKTGKLGFHLLEHLLLLIEYLQFCIRNPLMTLELM